MSEKRYTLQDDSLTHQVRIFNSKNVRNVWISCNCLKKTDHSGFDNYASMGEAVTLQDTAELYNNADNHTVPFNDEDRLKW